MSDSLPITTAPKRRIDHPALAAQFLMNLNTSESCKNTPNVVRKLEPHHRALIESGSHSAAASPLPQRRLDKLQGMICDKNTPLAIRRRLEGDDTIEPSPLVSRKFNQGFNGTSATNTTCSHQSPFPDRKLASMTTPRRHTEGSSSGSVGGGSIGRSQLTDAMDEQFMGSQSPSMRRRVDSDCTCAIKYPGPASRGVMGRQMYPDSPAKSILGEPGVFNSPVHKMQKFNTGVGNAPGSPAKSVIGEPGVFASPAHSVISKYDDNEDSPLLKDQTIVSGWLKFRDNKKVGGTILFLYNFKSSGTDQVQTISVSNRLSCRNKTNNQCNDECKHHQSISCLPIDSYSYHINLLSETLVKYDQTTCLLRYV